MSTQESPIAGRPTGPPFGAAKAFPWRGARVGRHVGQGLVVGPWGARPAHPGRADRRLVGVLQGAEKVALGLVYLAVLCGLPAAAISFLVGAS